MRLEGTRDFGGPQEAVYEAVTDPELVSSAIPALESLDVADSEHWTASVRISFAPRIKVAFELLEQRPPEHARLQAGGKNFAGGASMDTFFDLSGGNGRTRMRYAAEFHLSGIFGRLGEHALRPIAEKQMRRLFKAVDGRLASRA